MTTAILMLVAFGFGIAFGAGANEYCEGWCDGFKAANEKKGGTE